jgi:two-component system chemotaxis response regulator CheY
MIAAGRGVIMSTTPPIVLLIDDDADTREMYAVMLANAGFEVLQAEDGVEALAVAAERRPTIAVTDLRMPGAITAVELCRQLRDLNVPVIALTGLAPGAEHEAMRKAGCSVVLMKPLVPDRLVTEIAGVLSTGKSPK